MTNYRILYYLLLCSFFVLLMAACKQHPEEQMPEIKGKHAYTNALVNESSPYLLQHAHNPVNWHPWGDAALQKAKDENKMLLISVGYSACHWCHVMEHESFEDTMVARIMNENFIPIKVDREERPDVDDVYMTACHMASDRSCGWPLNAFALPDGRPVWAGTYFPKKEWTGVLEYFVKEYETKPEEMEKFATDLTAGIQSRGSINPAEGEATFVEEEAHTIAKNFLANIDFIEGGRNGAPKFPMPNNWEFLLEYYHQYGFEEALKAVQITLDKMAMGGIYDQLGGGFARYSTDEVWKAPHFEKMLYDNGQLVSLYAHAFQLTKDPLYEKTVRETLTFIERELTDETGGFYSSLDADSEGEEGLYYVWTKGEIDSLLNPETAKIFNAYYEVNERGNWEASKNILHRKKTVKALAKQLKLSEELIEKGIVEGKNALMQARNRRIRPGLDDKILTSWNALMLKGYVDAYKAFGDKKYLQSALKNGRFIVNNMLQKDNRLNRNYKDGKSVINAFLDDYALTAEAFMALYEVTFDEKWLDQAKALTDYAMAHFFDKESGMFYYTSDLDAALIARKMELTDNVIPGSNSAFARVLFRLGTYYYDTEYLGTARMLLHNMQKNILEAPQPNFYSNWCRLYLDVLKPPYEVAIVGADFVAKRDELMQSYLPNAILLGGETEGSLELLKGKLQEDETFIYVCQNKTCQLPVQDAEKALKQMK